MRGGTRDDFTHGSDDARARRGDSSSCAASMTWRRRGCSRARAVGVDAGASAGAADATGTPSAGHRARRDPDRPAREYRRHRRRRRWSARCSRKPAVVKVGVNLVKDVTVFRRGAEPGLARGRCCATRLVDLSGAFASASRVARRRDRPQAAGTAAARLEARPCNGAERLVASSAERRAGELRRRRRAGRRALLRCDRGDRAGGLDARRAKRRRRRVPGAVRGVLLRTVG